MASSSFGGTVKLTGESEYKKALKDITSNLKLVSSELKLTNAEFLNNDKSIKETKTSYSSMNNTVKEQKEKISDLKATLKQMEQEYGSNSEKVKIFKTQLNNAEKQLVELESSTDKSKKELKKFKEAEDEAGRSSENLGATIRKSILESEAIKKGFKQLVSLMKDVSNAILDVGKSALGGFSEYEQLIGGVETLFGESANVVESYANNAYKTAGLSANEYMETVTSFSASLLQSLNGDTAKSAEIADMAITDMADNANKMGTSMESIQNAYQGFAKQNYTMLDNLKLGYGGTKSEMERLLSDATKISGIKYDINSLKDVYKAIHVIQGELGITGTTAKEASTTIQGSVNSMKSAYSNLITGLADENANLEELAGNFVDSIITATDNLLPVVSTTINNMLNIIVEKLPNFLSKGTEILKTLLDGMTSNLDQIAIVISTVINTLITTIIGMLPQIIQMGVQLLVSLIQGISQTLPELIPQMVDTVLLIVDTLLDNIDLLVDTGIQLLLGLADGLIEALPKLIEKIPEIIDKLIIAITNNLPKIIEAGIELTIQLSVGIIKAIPQLVSKIPQIISSFISGITNSFSKIFDIGKELLGKVKDGIVSGISGITEVGKNLVQGLWNGINSAKDWVLDKIKGFGSSILNGIKSFFGIHSPSTVFKDEIGKNLALGLGEGFENEMIDVNKSIQESLPTDFDLSSNVNLSNNLSSLESTGISSNIGMVNAFKQALSEMTIVLDDEIAGKFVENSVERLIYS